MSPSPQKRSILYRLLDWVFKEHPRYLLYNTPEEVAQAPLPLSPPYVDMYRHRLGELQVLRPPYGEGELNYWPRESDIEFDKATKRTPLYLRAQGLFWFSQADGEDLLAYEEAILIRKLRYEAE